MVVEIKQIKPEETYEIRHKVLRPNESIEESKYEEDLFRTTFHLGAYLDEELISVASFYQEKNNYFEEESQYRLTGMATLQDHQGKGIGSDLLIHGENLLKKRNARLLWCNAKFPVSDYYKRFGLRERGKAFVIDSIGPHRVMYKLL